MNFFVSFNYIINSFLHHIVYKYTSIYLFQCVLCVSRKIAVERAPPPTWLQVFWGGWVYLRLAVACSPLPSDVMQLQASNTQTPQKAVDRSGGEALSTAIFRETHSRWQRSIVLHGFSLALTKSQWDYSFRPTYTSQDNAHRLSTALFSPFATPLVASHRLRNCWLVASLYSRERPLAATRALLSTAYVSAATMWESALTALLMGNGPLPFPSHSEGGGGESVIAFPPSQPRHVYR